MRLKEKIEEVLEHFDYCLIGVNGNATDNKLYCNFPTTPAILFKDLTISFGAERVSKQKGMIKVTE